MNTKERFQQVQQNIFQMERRLAEMEAFKVDAGKYADCIVDLNTSAFLSNWLEDMADLLERCRGDWAHEEAFAIFQKPSQLFVLGQRCVERMAAEMDAIEESSVNAVIKHHFVNFEIQFDMLRTNLHVFMQVVSTDKWRG